MSDYDDEDYETEHSNRRSTNIYHQEEGKEETKEETESSQTHGYSDEIDDGDIDDERRVAPKKSSTKISIGGKPQQQQSMDEDSGIDSDTKKTRRRNKDSSVDILNVIDWKLDGAEKYNGSEDIPETCLLQKGEKTDSLDRKDTKDDYDVFDRNEDKENHSTPKSSTPDKNKRKVQVRGKSLDEERALAAVTNNDNETKTNGTVTDKELKESLDFLNRSPGIEKLNSNLLNSLMDSYLDKDFVNKPPTLKKPSRPASKSSSRKSSSGQETPSMEELERNLKTIREKNKKQPPPPVRNKPTSVSKAWEDPREQQRLKVKEKQWPPKEPPKDVGAYVVESYGRTDPYTKQLIKDVQRSKREEVEKQEAEKRAEIVSENTQPVRALRDTFSNRPAKSALGALRPHTELHEERSWIQHEKKPVAYDEAPEEPDWMTLIRNRRWRSTVKARFPCKTSDKTDFDRRSTTPKNWKKLAKDKNALKMLSEIVGIGAEGEELFLRLANQRQKIEEDKEEKDKLVEQEILAYQVARESLGEEAAYSLQMDNPLPAARMKPVSVASNITASVYDKSENLPGLSNDALAGYPFTSSQLEAAYLSNQLLRLHPEEFRKLISLDRSRQATLRWQFSADPFDSVHEHQSLPYEMALLASDEPRILQAMRKIVATGSDDYRSVFSSTAPTPQPRSRARSEGGHYNSFYYESDGYESSNSVSSSSSMGIPRGRPKKKKKPPVPIPKQVRGRSVSPSMMGKLPPPTAAKPRKSSSSGSTLKVPGSRSATFTDDDNREVQAHSLFDDNDVQLADEIEDLNQLTANLSRNIDEELRGITSTLEDRKKGFFEEAIRNESEGRRRSNSTTDGIDPSEISSRRKDFVEKDVQNSSTSDVRADLPKTRHKVRRISSNAQLNAVFGGRRQMSEADADDNQQSGAPSHSAPVDDGQTKEDLANVLNDIQTHYGE